MPRGLELVYADQVQARHVMAPDWIGHAVPLHATSTGKAFLAAMADAELDALLPGRLDPLHGHDDHHARPTCAASSPGPRARLRVSRGELEPALWGVSAPVRDGAGRPAAVISVWGAETRIRDRLDALGAAGARRRATAGGAADA